MLTFLILLNTSFGVPQGSIIRPVSFKPFFFFRYHSVSKCQCLQYVDDNTIYTHCKVKNRKVTKQNLETELNNLLTWQTNDMCS